jgi:hypothetical protein
MFRSQRPPSDAAAGQPQPQLPPDAQWGSTGPGGLPGAPGGPDQQPPGPRGRPASAAASPTRHRPSAAAGLDPLQPQAHGRPGGPGAARGWGLGGGGLEPYERSTELAPPREAPRSHGGLPPPPPPLAAPWAAVEGGAARDYAHHRRPRSAGPGPWGALDFDALRRLSSPPGLRGGSGQGAHAHGAGAAAGGGPPGGMSYESVPGAPTAAEVEAAAAEGAAVARLGRALEARARLRLAAETATRPGLVAGPRRWRPADGAAADAAAAAAGLLYMPGAGGPRRQQQGRALPPPHPARSSYSALLHAEAAAVAVVHHVPQPHLGPAAARGAGRTLAAVSPSAGF